MPIYSEDKPAKCRDCKYFRDPMKDDLDHPDCHGDCKYVIGYTDNEIWGMKQYWREKNYERFKR